MQHSLHKLEVTRPTQAFVPKWSRPFSKEFMNSRGGSQGVKTMRNTTITKLQQLLEEQQLCQLQNLQVPSQLQQMDSTPPQDQHSHHLFLQPHLQLLAVHHQPHLQQLAVHQWAVPLQHHNSLQQIIIHLHLQQFLLTLFLVILQLLLTLLPTLHQQYPQ